MTAKVLNRVAFGKVEEIKEGHWNRFLMAVAGALLSLM